MSYGDANLPLETSVLGVSVEEDDIRDLVRQKYPELNKIIQCESTWREKVCSFAGCEAGMGYAQIIPNTLLYCEKKLGRKLDAFNGQDNLECALWLYTNEGNRHWDSSKDCWNI